MSCHETLIVLQPSSFCNIDCSYCYLPGRNQKNQMSDEVLNLVFRRVFESRILRAPFAFLWHLGEPLAVPVAFYERAFEICKLYARGQEYVHSFQTNAMLISPAWIDLVKRHGVIVGVSIDGPSFLHDANRVDRRGRGSHGRTMAGVKALQAAGVPFSAIGVLTDQSLDHVDEIFDFYYHNRIYDIAFNIEEFEGVHEATSHGRPDSAARYKAFLTSMLARIDQTGGTVKVREVWKTARTISMGTDAVRNTTNEAFEIVNIAANGDFSTWCPELMTADVARGTSFIIGNVITDDFETAAKSERFRQLAHEIASGRDLCKASCDYWAFCGGGTPANKFFEHGRLDVAETRTCQIHLQATVDVMLEYLGRQATDCDA